MKLDSLPGASFTNASETIDYSIGKANQDMVMDLLATKLYSDPILAPIREIVTNAFDAHLMVNKKDEPVLINAPTKLSPLFVVRDFGPGISQEDMPSVLSFGHSTKRNDQNATGGFGIGIKSPYAVTNDFLLTSYRNGKIAIWRSFKTNGKPKAALLHYGDTDEPNGIKFEIPISIDILENFNIALFDFLSFVKSPYKVTPKLPLNYEVYESDETGLPFSYFSFNNRETKRFSGQPAFVRMGDILYKIPTQVIFDCKNFAVGNFIVQDELTKWYGYCKTRLSVKYLVPIIDLPIGSLPISPSREEIIASSSSTKILSDLVSSKLDEFVLEAKESFDSHYATNELALETMALFYLITFRSSYGQGFLDPLSSWRIGDLLKNEESRIHQLLAQRLELPSKEIISRISDNSSLSYSDASLFISSLIMSKSFMEDVGLIFVDVNHPIGAPERTKMQEYVAVNHWFYRKNHTVNTYCNSFPKYIYDLLRSHDSPILETIGGISQRCSYLFGIHNTTGKGYTKISPYYVTKPLSEIKDPINRIIVATFFELMPEKKASLPKKSSSATKILKRSEEVPPVYSWNGKSWAPRDDQSPLQGVLYMRYKTGVSRTFSEHNVEIDSTTYKRALNHFPSEKLLIALREDMPLDSKLYPDAITPEEYADSDFTYSRHYYQWMRDLHKYNNISDESIVLNPKIKNLFHNFQEKNLDSEDSKLLFQYLSRFLFDHSFTIDHCPLRLRIAHTPYSYNRNLKAEDIFALYNHREKRHIARYILPIIGQHDTPYLLPILRFLLDPTRTVPIEHKTFAAVFPQIVADFFEVELEDASVAPPELLSKYVELVIHPLFEYYWPPISLKKV